MSGLYDPFRDSNDYHDRFKTHSCEDSTISTFTSSPSQSSSRKDSCTLSRTITSITVILQDISTSLGEFASKQFASQDTLNALVRSYMQLLNITTDGMRTLNSAFMYMPQRERAPSPLQDLSASLAKRENSISEMYPKHKEQIYDLHDDSPFQVDDYHREDDDDLTISTMEVGFATCFHPPLR